MYLSRCGDNDYAAERKAFLERRKRILRLFETEYLQVGELDTELVKEFFYAVSYSAGMNLHIKMLSPGNNHHMIEAMFKAFAQALDQAVSYNPKVTDVLSTKGSL